MLAAFAPPGLPSPGFLRRAAEVEQTLQWCEQRPNDPFATEILRGLLTEAGLKPASPSPNPPTVRPDRRFVESAPRCRPASCRSVSAYRSAVNRRSAPPADPPNPPPPTADSPKPPPPADLPPPESVALELRPQCPELTPPPPPAPTRRDRATRKQAAVQDIAHRAFPPKGEVPPNISTARFKRDHVDPSWEVVAPTYGLAGSLPPDWHTVSRAISREL